MSVVKINKFKDVNMYKIEGDAFKKVRARRKELTKFLDEAQKKAKEYHTALWDAIEEETGKKEEKHFYLDTEYEELGFYVVKKNSKSNPFDLFNLLTK